MKKIIKVSKYVFSAFLVVLVSLFVYSFVMTTLLKKDYVNVFGYSFFVASSGSMTGAIEVNDIVFVKLNDKFKANDIVTFINDDGEIITHRLITDRDGKYVTKGDANDFFDDAIDEVQIIGRVKYVVSPLSIIRWVAVVLVVFILISLINFENIIKKYIKKEAVLADKGLPDDLFSNPKKKYDDPTSGLTVTIKLPVMETINKMNDEDAKRDEEIEVLDLVESLFPDETSKKSNIDDIDKENIDLVVSILKCKKDSSETKMSKKWLIKYQHIYKLCHLLLIKNYKSFGEETFNPPFKEIYDYDLDNVGLTEVVRNKVYKMPIYSILKILTYCILYNDDEMFDGIYKIMKYKLEIDKDNNYKQLSKNESVTVKQVKILVSFMKKISNKFDKKNVFNLDKIERMVKISNY